VRRGPAASGQSAWTLTEAAKIGYLDVVWPKQYRAAKAQLERNLERERAPGRAGHGPIGARAGERELGGLMAKGLTSIGVSGARQCHDA